MNRKTMMAVIAAVAIVAVATVAAAGMLAQAPAAGEEDYRGHWYAIDCEVYGSAGVYSHLSAEESKVFGMDIYECIGGVFNGRSAGVNISGMLQDDQISFSYSADDGKRLIAIGNFDDGNLYLGIYYIGFGASGSEPGVISAVLSRDLSSTVRLLDADSIFGQWRLVDGIVYNGEAHAVTKGTSLGITGQNGSIFKGTVELDHPGSTPQSFDTRGAIHYVKGSVGIGMMIDGRGGVWSMHLNDGMLTIETIRTLDFEPDGGQTDIGVERRSYSQDRTSVYTPFEIGRAITGTTWKCIKVEEMDPWGNTSVMGMKSFLTVVDCYENYLFCTESTYAGPVSLVVMCHSDGDGPTRALNDRNGSMYLFSDIVFIDDDHFVVYVLYNDGEDNSVITRYFERYTDDTDYDLAGHWYATLRAGYDENGDFILDTPSDSRSISEFDLDVYSLEDGLFRGWFMDRYVVGYSEGDGITFMDSGHGECYRIVGTFENSNSLTINEAYWDADGGSISGYTTYFTKDRGAVSHGVVDLDVSGQWVLSDGTAYYPDAAVPLSKPQYMEVISESNGTFVGNIDMKGANHVIEKIGIRGVALPSVGADTYTGFMLTEDGDLWFCRFADSTIYMSMSSLSVNPDHLGEMSVVEKVFTRDGSQASILLPETDLRGTWKGVEMSMLCNDGTYSEEFISYVLHVDSQMRNMALGTCKYDDILSGGFSLSLQFLGNNTVMEYCVELLGATDVGTGILIDPDHLVVIEWYHDTNGNEWVQRTLFERQAQ